MTHLPSPPHFEWNTEQGAHPRPKSAQLMAGRAPRPGRGNWRKKQLSLHPEPSILSVQSPPAREPGELSPCPAPPVSHNPPAPGGLGLEVKSLHLAPLVRLQTSQLCSSGCSTQLSSVSKARLQPLFKECPWLLGHCVCGHIGGVGAPGPLLGVGILSAWTFPSIPDPPPTLPALWLHSTLPLPSSPSSASLARW